MNTNLSNKFWDVSINRDIQSIILKFLLPSIEDVKKNKENVLYELINGFFYSNDNSYGHEYIKRTYLSCSCKGCDNVGRARCNFYTEDKYKNVSYRWRQMCIKHYRIFRYLREKIYPDFVRDSPDKQPEIYPYMMDVVNYINTWHRPYEVYFLKYFGRFIDNKYFDKISLL